MKCKICGGVLIFNGNIYECSACNNKISLLTAFEETEVYIAYIENDENGRRTRDSIIAQEIYNKFNNININSFYQRMSADGVIGETLETACDFAISSAKIIVIIATNKSAFDYLINKHKNYFADKLIVPIYANMEANDIPNELKNLQALNYSNVGSFNDLSKKVLTFLNRQNEYNIADLTVEKQRKKSRGILIATISIICLLIIGMLYYVFGTDNVLMSKKYDAAISLLNKQMYTQAIEKFVEISEYKDSSEQLDKIYNQYNGYYVDKKAGVEFYLSIKNSVEINVEIKKQFENDNIIISEKGVLNKVNAEINYTDNKNNNGVAIINFLDDEIELIITDDNKSFKDNVIFNINEKTDKSNFAEITSNIIYKWLTTDNLTDEDIIEQGYEIIFECSILDGGNPAFAEYSIANTNVKLLLSEYESPFALEGKLDNKRVFAISAPASIILPEYVGKTMLPFIKDDISFSLAYITNGKSFMGYLPQNDLVIEEETMINCSSKSNSSDTYWEWVNNVYHQQ